jgi:hypothetical protein
LLILGYRRPITLHDLGNDLIEGEGSPTPEGNVAVAEDVMRPSR